MLHCKVIEMLWKTSWQRHFCVCD